MAWLKNMSLRKSFFVLTFAGLFLALLLLLALWRLCLALAAQYPSGGVAFEIDGSITRLPSPTPEELRILNILYFAGRHPAYSKSRFGFRYSGNRP